MRRLHMRQKHSPLPPWGYEMDCIWINLGKEYPFFYIHQMFNKIQKYFVFIKLI